MRSVDYAAAREQRDEYAYLIDNECVRLLGRLTGAGIFMILYFKGSEELALRIALILLSLILANTIWLSKKLNPKEPEKIRLEESKSATLLVL